MARPAGDIRERVIEAARTSFLRDGVDGASLRAIARAAGTNLGMVYYYFPTKDALFSAVLDDFYRPAMERLSAAMAAEPDPERRLWIFYQMFAALDDRSIATVRLVLREILVSADRRQFVLDTALAGHVPLLVGAVAEAIALGRFATGGSPIAATMAAAVLAVMPQIMVRLARDSLGPLAAILPTPEELAATCFDILRNGLHPRAP